MLKYLNTLLPLLLVLLARPCLLYNGNNFELECPDSCDCHYFRINWVTDCSEYNLTEIPYDELSLNVYTLDMNGNMVTSLKPFPKNIKMRRFQISHNFITRVEKETFEGLEYLIDVDLSSNKINYIDPDTFEDCPGLLTLELQENQFDPIEGPFLVSRSLQYLDISYSNIKTLNPEFFVNLTSLHILDLSGNFLETLAAEIFDPLTTIETLKLNDCGLNYISDNSFIYQQNLKNLELARNQLPGIDWTYVLGKLHSLEYLNLNNSNIVSLPEDSFANTTFLRVLILANNELTTLDVGNTIGNNAPHLETLDLSHCHLKGTLSSEAFVNASRLKTLYLSGNSLFVSDLQNALGPLEGLEKLYLSNCDLKSLPESFSKLKNLEELDLSHNPLVDAFTKILTPLEKLEYLNMGYCNLSHIGRETFSKMTSMRKLVLSGNDLNSLESGLFGNLTHLESLELNYCGLKRPINTRLFFSNLSYTELTELKLAGNPLVVTKDSLLLPKQLSRLQKLDLSDCNITYLPDFAFRHTENITELNLSGNSFYTHEGNLKFLQLLPHLTKLDLGNNNLTTLRPKVFLYNPKLNWLRLVGNPWKCSCDIAEFYDWAMMIKHDLSVLVGSKTSPDDFTLKGAKMKKSLICNYDEKDMKRISVTNNTTLSGRRPFSKPQKDSMSTNRTWIKYVRESECPQIVSLIKPERLVQPEALVAAPSGSKNSSIDYETLSISIVAMLLIIGIGASIFIMSTKKTMIDLSNELPREDNTIHRDQKLMWDDGKMHGKKIDETAMYNVVI